MQPLNPSMRPLWWYQNNRWKVLYISTLSIPYLWRWSDHWHAMTGQFQSLKKSLLQPTWLHNPSDRTLSGCHSSGYQNKYWVGWVILRRIAKVFILHMYITLVMSGGASHRLSNMLQTYLLTIVVNFRVDLHFSSSSFAAKATNFTSLWIVKVHPLNVLW